MAMSSVNFKVESELKNEAQQVFKEMGMNMTTAINMFLSKTVQERKLPFQPTAKPQPEVIFDELSEELQEKLLMSLAIVQESNPKGYSLEELVDKKQELKKRL